MADATTIGPHAIAASGQGSQLGVKLMGADFSQGGAWTGPPSRAREDGAEKYLRHFFGR